MDTEFTLGPWFINENSSDCGGDKLSVEANEDYFIAQVDGGISQLANARLIAAAPELLEALQKANFRLQFANKHVYCTEEIDLCNAAIAKATKGDE